MKTFREFCIERHGAWPGPAGARYSDIQMQIFEDMADYIDEVVAPAAQNAAHPLVSIDGADMLVGVEPE